MLRSNSLSRRRQKAPSSDITAAQQAVALAQLSRDRLQAVLPKLRDRLSAVLNTEAHDHWREDYRRVKAQRDQAANVFAEYPELATRLIEIFRAAQAVDKEVDRVNWSAPDGEHRRLIGVRYVLEGSVRKATNRVRITGQLVDTATGARWTGRAPPRTAQRMTGGLDKWVNRYRNELPLPCPLCSR
jgi:hypothetical protein